MIDNLEKELKRLRDERQKKFTEEDWEGALEIHDKILELSPSALRYANRGSILYRLGRLEEAVESYRIALEMEPTLKRARADLERLEAQLPKPSEENKIQEPEAIYSQEPEPIYSQEAQPIYSQESQPIYSQEPEPIYSQEPEPIYSQEPEPIYSQEAQPIYSQESQPIYPQESQPIYSQESQPNYADIQKEIAECKDRRQVAMAKEDWNAALQYHLRIVELEPTAQRYATLGSLFYRVGRMEEAIESYQNATTMDPTLEKVQHDLQKLLKQYNKKYASAPATPVVPAQVIATPIASAPIAPTPVVVTPTPVAPVAPAHEKNRNAIQAQVEELRKQRQAYIDAEDWETVLEIHDKILALDPNGLRYSNRGAFLYRLGRYQEALEAYRTALSLDPSLSGIQEQIQNLEDLLAEEESFANDKSTQYTSSEDIANKIEELRIQRQQYLDAKEWEKALALNDQIIALEPTALRYVNRGSILYRMQRLEEAIESYQKALQLDPNMGRAKIDLERMQAELQEYQFGIPEPQAHTGNKQENLAEKLEQLRLKRQKLVQEDKWEEALSVHDQILALEPTAARYVTKGSMLYAIGRVDESILNYRKALELDPNFERAQSDLQKLAESEMDRLRVQRQEAMAEENWERALELHDVILALDPSALRYANRGSILYRMNRFQEAKEAYQKALSLDPTLEKAKTDLEELEEELAMNPGLSEKKIGRIMRS